MFIGERVSWEFSGVHRLIRDSLTIKIWEYTDTPVVEDKDKDIEVTLPEQANEAPEENNEEVAIESTELPSKESTEAQKDTTITEDTDVTTTDRMDEN